MNRTRRSGYTILELLVVLALLVILGAVIIPSLTGFEGNAKQRAAGDIVRTRLAEARAKAIERGTPFRVAVNTDRTRLRTAPDDENFAGYVAAEQTGLESTATEDTLEGVMIDVELEEGDERAPDPAGWITVATYRPDGSSKEARPTVVSIQQTNFPPLLVQVRGVTGSARTLSNKKSGGGP